jgi:multidrug resistance efflux pump
VKVAEANVDLQRDLSERARRLRPTGAMAVEDVNQRTLTLAVARRQLAQATAEDSLLKAGAWKFDKHIAGAQVALAEAQVLQTRTDLDRVLVRAPRDGVVLQVNVREGEYVGTPPGQVALGSPLDRSKGKSRPALHAFSAKGPSVTSRLPSRTRTLVAVETG